ncbi:hypothetical protein LC082_05830 [Microbacterium esteraromaticum]|nr:hypothetical protein [Microbacterium esteraromaticum]
MCRAIVRHWLRRSHRSCSPITNGAHLAAWVSVCCAGASARDVR